ncbi:MAG: hypothetical protein H7315_03620 [Herminiimonas sp.]|nr:hypothetical protein [Herminiimonas sp.]
MLDLLRHVVGGNRDREFGISYWLWKNSGRYKKIAGDTGDTGDDSRLRLDGR